MKISLHQEIKDGVDSILLPISKGDDLKPALEAVAGKYDFSSRTLARSFLGEASEVFPFSFEDKQIFLLGLGDKPDFSKILRAFRSFSHKYRQKISPRLGVDLLGVDRDPRVAEWAEAAVNGLVLGTYRIGRYKTGEQEVHPLREEEAHLAIYIDKEEASVTQLAVDRGRAVAETQLAILDLVNAPSNKKLPEDLADWAIGSGKKHGFRVEVFDKDRILVKGLHALLAVNQGSAAPPSFIIMEYRWPGKDEKSDIPKVGLVGKGVTFDTGGVSIKPSANMHLMKSDMGGAAAVFGAMEVAAKLKLPIHLIGIVPATENTVDATAIRPSDVIDSHSGKTIEIIDTDAEGRLILADGLSYMMKEFAPDILIDLATLTGSTVRTLGYHAAGLFSNSDRMAEALRSAGEKCGECLWRLPLWDVYKEDLKSDVADIRNYSGRPVAGAIVAAKFLETFIHEHPEWAHLDIAGVAFCETELSSQKSATAFGVRLITEYLMTLGKE